MTISIEIPVKTHVFAYLVRRYGTDRIRMTKGKHDPIHQFFTGTVAKPAKIRKVKKDRHPCTITFLVGEDFVKKVGCVIEEEVAMNFNAFVDHLLRQEFYMFMQVQIAYGKQRKEAILEYIDRYFLQMDGVNYETLKKAYYRFEQKNSEKILGNIVPSVGTHQRKPKSTNPNTIRWRRWKAKQRRLKKAATYLLTHSPTPVCEPSAT